MSEKDKKGGYILLKTYSILILVSVFAVIGISSANAQHSARVGVKGGFSSFQLEDEDFAKSENLGYAVGAYCVYGISQNIGLQVEALYLQKGGGYKTTIFAYSGLVEREEFMRSYLEIPTLLKWAPLSDVTYFLAGPTYCFRLNGEEYHRKDYASFLIGFGYDFIWTTTTMSLECRYQKELGDNLSDSNGITLLAGLRF